MSYTPPLWEQVKSIEESLAQTRSEPGVDALNYTLKKVFLELHEAESDRSELSLLLQNLVNACEACLVEMSRNGDSIVVRHAAVNAIEAARVKWSSK